MIARGIPVTVLLLLLGSLVRPTLAEERLDRTQLDSILLAITDEIYAHGYNVHYRDLDPAKVPVYIKPDAVGQFWVLYKLLPHGEVLRLAYVGSNKGLATLHGNPDTGFPPTQGAATNVIYLRDDDVIRMKTTWRKEHFSIDPEASLKTIEDAKRRQKVRYER